MILRIDEEEGEGAVLIFMPGWEEISKLHQSLSARPESRRWKLFPLHSQLPMDQQRYVAGARAVRGSTSGDQTPPFESDRRQPL